MSLTLTANMFGIYKKPDFKQSTGEVKKGKTVIQLMMVETLSDGRGTKNVLLDVSILDSKVSQFRDKVGKEVSVEVGYMISDDKKRVIFYGI